MNDRQIEVTFSMFRNELMKHSPDLPSYVAQQVLYGENLGMEMFAPFLERAKLITNFGVRTAKVNRSRSAYDALMATGFELDISDRKIVDSMPKPKGEGDEGKILFFEPDFFRFNGLVSYGDFESKLASYGLKPADPILVAAANEADKTLAEIMPHRAHWVDANGTLCHVSFLYWENKHEALVDRTRYIRATDWRIPCVQVK